LQRADVLTLLRQHVVGLALEFFEISHGLAELFLGRIAERPGAVAGRFVEDY